jgi:CheY-like chemotaxis protein
VADLLIVEDDPDLADALGTVLLSLGHCVRTAADGLTGLQLINDRRPDLVLLDVEMPILDGPGLATELLLHDLGLEEIPLFLLSAVVDLPDIAARVGTPYFLEKPYRLDQFLALLERALQERIPPHQADGV